MSVVVVGVDESVAAERALDRALLEAGSTGRGLRVVRAWTAYDGHDGTSGGRAAFDPSGRPGTAAQERADELVAKAVSRASGQHPPELQVEAHLGHPGQVLVRSAQDAGLLVVGGDGDGELTSAVLGRTTAYVLHHATCPVMVVPAAPLPPAPWARVVVGLDGSRSSRTALRFALEAAQRAGCPLVPVYAWQTNMLPARAPMRFMHPPEEYAAAAGQWLDQELADALPEGSGVRVRPMIAHSTPGWGLMAVATPEDLLVVGSRGHGGFHDLLLGSVASQVAQHARGTVVVVRPDRQHPDAGR